MSSGTDIEWTKVRLPDGRVLKGATWNCLVGCQKVSSGCQSCYAIRTAYRLEHAFNQEAYQGTTRKLPDGSVNWTGRVKCLRERLEIPLHWREPRGIFVNSMSDLFHPDVPDEFIDQVFGIMAHAPQHIFQVLTKRPERMLPYILRLQDKLKHEQPYLQAVSVSSVKTRTEIGWAQGRFGDPEFDVDWPLPNVWLGVSCEDQRAADERIPLLLQTPVAVRWLSCEPLIGPVSFRWAKWVPIKRIDATWHLEGLHGIDWIVTGGESGPNYRPCDQGWVRAIRDECQEYEEGTGRHVAFLHKQWGGHTHAAGGRLLDGREWSEYPEAREAVHAQL